MNAFLLKKIREDSCDLYLYGAGCVAKHIYKILKDENIKIKGFFVDDAYWEKNKIGGLDVLKISEIKTINNISIVMAMQYMKKGKGVEKWGNVKKVYYPAYIHIETGENTEQFLKKYKDDYNEFIGALGDSLSKEIMTSYIDSIKTGDGEKILEYYDANDSYFNASFWKAKQNSVYVDVGAYTGDTIEKFLEYTNGKFKIIYAFEANEELYAHLVNKIKRRDNINIYNAYLTNTINPIIVREAKNDTGNVGFIVGAKNGGKVISGVRLDDVVKIKGEDVLIKCNTSRDGVADILYSAEQLIYNNIVDFVIKIGYIKQSEIMKIFSFFRNKKEYKLYLRLVGERADDMTLFAIYHR